MRQSITMPDKQDNYRTENHSPPDATADTDATAGATDADAIAASSTSISSTAEIPRVPDLIAGRDSIDDWRQSMQRMREDLEARRRSQRDEMDQRRDQMRKKREAMRERAERMREDTSSQFKTRGGRAVQLDEEGNVVPDAADELSSGLSSASEILKKHEERMQKLRESTAAQSMDGATAAAAAAAGGSQDGSGGGSVHQRQVEGKVKAIRDRLERDADKFDAAALREIEAELGAYQALEARIDAHTQSGAEDFDKVGAIEDPEARKEYMQKLRDERKARREEETQLRKEAREKYNGIQRLLDARINVEL